MFYRRKLILALLQVFDGQLDKISLQQLLFLTCKKQATPTYEFIPHTFGCHSYSAEADLATMVSKGQLYSDASVFIKPDTENYLNALNEQDQKIVADIRITHGCMSANALMNYTGENYPYWAIYSEAAGQQTDTGQQQRIAAARPASNKTALFTIGYEGLSLEGYLNRLIRHCVRVLVDVRRNPLSQKFGFSKSQLMKYCAALNIKYVHIPEVGIRSDLRRELATQADYDKLFAMYRKGLPALASYQQQIFELLLTEKRIALTCFEANVCQCHRTHLAESIKHLPAFNYELKHI